MRQHCAMSHHHTHLLPRRVAALLGLATLALAACAADTTAPPATPAPAAKTSAELMEPIKALIGEAECDHPSQCFAVPVGAKACGGPAGFLAWSSKGTDQKALLAAVQTQAEAQKAENAKSGLASDCRMITQMQATCRPRSGDGKKVCQLGQGGVRGLD
jgi:hypothetical protein